ncbi:hypothetical protein [Olivibacter domesticus]|uniref:VWFA domain-containing protein n=1 Tax=Olivibacter domesticus TaxID=407022 RepID=A0A1H7UES7_OLID1|nr:hypothetical protein [Olivibacter domesticus]SEL94727.1 hypothetical protein SAMN05661044_03833 [Olivibacter domesticus]
MSETKKVDLVIAIDTSNSMKDEAQAISAAIEAAVSEAKKACPSDLRVTYLGIEGTFPGTKFVETVRGHLTKAGADPKAFKSRLRKSLPGSGAQEDGARVVEDLSEHNKWREGAERAIFLLQDESLDGGDMIVTPSAIEANDKAIEAALKNEVKVHTYLGTPDASLQYPSKEAEEDMIKEFKRLALRTGGDHNIYVNGLPDFKKVLKDTICASKIPQEESIEDKKDEADNLDKEVPADKPTDKPTEEKPTDKPKEETPTDKPTVGKLTCTDLCDQLPEIAKAVDTLTTFLKNFEEVCKNAKEHDEDCKCKDKKPANETTTPVTPKPEDSKPVEKPVEEKPVAEKPATTETTPQKPVAEKPAVTPEKPATPTAPVYTEVDEIFAIVLDNGVMKINNQPNDNGDIYAHRGGSGELLRKAIESSVGSGQSNGLTSDQTHYLAWNPNQIYRGKEGQRLEYLRGLSGGRGKDGFAFRKDDVGFFYSAYEGGKIYTFQHPQTTYNTVQVRGTAGDPLQPFTTQFENMISDINFDGDDRLYLMSVSGHIWRVDNTKGTDLVAKHLCKFSPSFSGQAGERCDYYGLAFDSHGGVYLSGGNLHNGWAMRFIVKSSFASPDKLERIYQGPWGSASYGNLASRAYPKFAL